MKQHKSTYLIIILMLFSVVTHAQEPESMLKFQSMVHDFGHIKEDGGEQLCSFFAINEGKSAIKVTEIKTSCGCTSAQYTKGDIAPNEKFEVTVGFNPFNRPGRIDKHIYIIVSDSEAPICLTIEGFVQERERTIDELYPFDMGGGLRLRSNFHAFGYMEHGATMEEHIGYVNTSLEPIIIDIEHTVQSGHLSLSHPTTIAAGATGDITLRYSIAEGSDVYGTISDILYIIVGGARARYTLGSEAIITDNFSMVDDISAPRGDISKKIIKFGEINCTNRVLEEVVTVTNTGASPLILRSIESSSCAVESVADSMEIAPNQSIELRIRLHTERIELTEGIFTARLRIITNDPIRPMQTIKVNAIID